MYKMDDFLKLLVFACLLFWPGAWAAPVKPHESGGQEQIVIIDKDADLPRRIEEVLERLALNPKHNDVRMIYNNSAFYGFAASMKSHCLDLLANMTDVKLVEPAVSVANAALVPRARAYDTRANSPWGLQRISTAAVVGGNPDQMDYTYSYANGGLGAGSDIYIIDTGIYTEHKVFTDNRAKNIWSFEGSGTDQDGHGTHVAGTAAGDILGVASKANVYGLKALDSEGGGLSSNVVAAIDLIVRQHDARKAAGGDFKGSVMSMSLASTVPVQAINDAIDAAIQAGIHTVVAAGNNGGDACDVSPAASGGTQGPAITVGAIGIDATRAEFSNSGRCVDIYAPGEQIISSWIGGPDMVNSLSGTSMATPHVTGIIAYAMANSTLAHSPGLMKEWLRMTALELPDGTLMANNGVHAGGDDDQGVVGFEKIPVKGKFSASSDTRTKPTKRDTFEVEAAEESIVWKRAFEGVDQDMACRREAQMYEDTAVLKGNWLCNTRSLRRRGLQGMRSLLSKK